MAGLRAGQTLESALKSSRLLRPSRWPLEQALAKAAGGQGVFLHLPQPSGRSFIQEAGFFLHRPLCFLIFAFVIFAAAGFFMKPFSPAFFAA